MGFRVGFLKCCLLLLLLVLLLLLCYCCYFWFLLLQILLQLIIVHRYHHHHIISAIIFIVEAKRVIHCTRKNSISQFTRKCKTSNWFEITKCPLWLQNKRNNEVSNPRHVIFVARASHESGTRNSDLSITSKKYLPSLDSGHCMFYEDRVNRGVFPPGMKGK